ncbi:GIP, partial [Symbiodinium pilosum]
AIGCSIGDGKKEGHGVSVVDGVDLGRLLVGWNKGPPPVVVPPPVDVIIAPEAGPRNPVGNIEEQPEHEASPAVSETAEGEIPLLDTATPELDAAMPEPVDIPVPEDDEDDLLFGDTECFLVHPEANQVWEIGIHETDIEPCNLPSPTQALHYVMLATQDRKKRVEVRLRDLSGEEQEQFSQAKQKEVGAWLDHATVRKVAAGTLDDSQLMRCRWILSWKDPEKVGGPKRAKARLVVLGFEDPDLSSIPNDAPTLGKDARQLILQKVASNKWKLINFDVSTAFLQGKGDGRKLGIRPPPELRTALDMKEHDQCLLECGAYGRVDAPFLWFQTFKETLENLGFIQCPFDACTFCLVTPKGDGVPKVHGVLGIHVDDGIGGGDGYFSKVIKELRAIYNFGSYDEGEFNFTGTHFRQWLDGSIEMDQTTYIEKIAPIHLPRERRTHSNASLTPEEVKELRRLNGSLQHAAVHTRPDLAAKENNSYQGTLVMITDWRMLANEKAVIVPVAWCSKKIARVVRSTLSAEVVSLSGLWTVLNSVSDCEVGERPSFVPSAAFDSSWREGVDSLAKERKVAQGASGLQGYADRSTGGLGHLPWQQVPRFIPGVTNVDEYSQRLQFLKELWPPEHLQHLAPRAALMVEGAAFHKISRIAPDKLRSADGVKLLVESLGGSWGKTAVEEKYHYFEQAMFQVAQKTDESNDSYISRHDAAFEELLARKVTLEEIRAYILLRHSLLSPDDKKRVVVEAKGDLKYQDTVKSIRLLGSKFFSEFQQRGSGQRGSERSKVYDVNATFEEEQSEEIHMTEDDDHDEDILVMFLNQGDGDAVYITEFEDSIVEAVQESTLAPVFTSYTEARQRLRDKAKARGYFKPKGKGIKGTAFKKGKSGHGEGFRQKSLAERIATSSCRLCGGRGHWKRECPKRDDKTETTHYTQAEYDSPFLPELTPHIPEYAVYYHEDDVEEEDGQVASAGGSRICGREHMCLTASPEVKPKPSTDFEAAFARRMLMLSRTPEWARDAARRSLAVKKAGKRPGGAVESSSRMSCQQGPGLEESILVTTAGAEGVLDTGVVIPIRLLSLLFVTVMPASLSKAAAKLHTKLPVVDMEEPLSGPEDSQLAPETQCLQEFLEVDYVRPAGVRTLQEWSRIKAEQGKHRHLTFGEIFEKDLRYAMVMARKSTLTSAWALSFKGYSQARLKKMAQQQIKKTEGDLDDWK